MWLLQQELLTGRGSGQGVPMIMVCYDSRVDKLQKVKNLFTALDVSGTTPEGLCFEAIEKDLIPGNSNQDSYFINFLMDNLGTLMMKLIIR